MGFHSVKELCVSFLKSHCLLWGVCASGSCASLEVLDDHNTKSYQSCKICDRLGKPSKMLICDICEEAFHASCCRPKKRKLPVYEWYCQPCSGKKPKPLIDQKSGRSCNSVDGLPGKKIIALWGVLDSIGYMLQENQPYATGVRISKDFQVEVQSGLV